MLNEIAVLPRPYYTIVFGNHNILWYRAKCARIGWIVAIVVEQKIIISLEGIATYQLAIKIKMSVFLQKRIDFLSVWHRKRLVSFAMLLAGEPKWIKEL